MLHVGNLALKLLVDCETSNQKGNLTLGQLQQCTGACAFSIAINHTGVAVF